MKEKLAKLLSVKSLVTLALTGIFAYMSISGRVDGDAFMNIYTIVVAFYFGTQYQRNSELVAAAQQ